MDGCHQWMAVTSRWLWPVDGCGHCTALGRGNQAAGRRYDLVEEHMGSGKGKGKDKRVRVTLTDPDTILNGTLAVPAVAAAVAAAAVAVRRRRVREDQPWVEGCGGGGACKWKMCVFWGGFFWEEDVATH